MCMGGGSTTPAVAPTAPPVQQPTQIVPVQDPTVAATAKPSATQSMAPQAPTKAATTGLNIPTGA